MPENEKRVLLVDDDPMTAKVVTRILVGRDSGIVVFNAADLNGARRAIDEQAWRLVVTDGNLGDGGLGKGGICDGKEVARLMHAKDPNAPVFLLSGRAADEDERALFTRTFVKIELDEFVQEVVLYVNQHKQ